ncbi:hypothetical protein HYPSUDRAFT_63416 [Hypholoma sublateritium FD-334 SS-4]|uniref:CSN8/PSMD8/EIF3K domain-containing protein n=1 Tax=Hypholoma sublateritium (strain FD-334 SS-4) TaxID=945553 RepID=A0A0D2PF48_HYPSF|nr:hypothetical protein HYPSUDRAFT_63416 [Hypholoma sublateritium FD-334 SS-4]
MVNGPPTPPATTPVELQDAARSTASVAEPSVSLPPQIDPQLRPEVYQRALQGIGAALARKDYQSAGSIAGEADFITATDRQPARMLIVAPLVLVHLINDNIPPARYALLRLPDNLISLPLARALGALVIYAMNRQHAQLYEQINILKSIVSQPDFFDQELGHQVVDLATVFTERFCERTFILLSKAYTSLPLSLACIYLNLPAEKVTNGAQKSGWSYDASTQILYPSYSSLATFDLVADSVARLEG